MADIDHYDERKVFTVDPIKWRGLNEYFEEIEREGMKTIMILDPFLIANYSDYPPYQRGFDKKAFIEWPEDYANPDYADTNSSVMLGYVCIYKKNQKINIMVKVLFFFTNLTVLARRKSSIS